MHFLKQVRIHAMKNEATGRVKNVTIPAGEAPEWVRQAWVGLVLPCYPVAGFPTCPELGVLSGRPDGAHCKDAACDAGNGRDGVRVPQTGALTILELYNPNAARWWKTNGYPKHGEHENCFGFATQEVQIISGVVFAKVVEVTDEMMGDPYR
jgi:hypothetical protein